jgi:DNA repair protein RadD
VNYGVLTTGFDNPRLDVIAILRPTMSPGLLVQMIGRGTRLAPGKQDCLVLDYAGNIERHGPVDQITAKEKGTGDGPAPAKECPQCHSLIATGYATCPDCGHAFPPSEAPKHEAQATSAGVLSGQVTTERFEVHETFYHLHVKRGAGEDAPRTLRVDYQVGLNEFKSEWICLEHSGYARAKAVAWWKRRSPDPVPDSIERAVDIAEAGGLAPTRAITVRTVAGDPYERIIAYELGEVPEAVPAGASSRVEAEEDIPF